MKLTFVPPCPEFLDFCKKQKRSCKPLVGFNVDLSNSCCNVLQEVLLLDPMFEIPDSDVLSVHITEEAVLKKAPPVYIRGKQVNAEEDTEDMQARAEVK